MKILGIDYGRKKTGLSISDGPLASPFRVIRHKDGQDLVKKIKRITEQENIEEIVVGITEGEMGKEQEKFADKIGAKVFDETLSTQDAKTLSVNAGIKRKTRKEMEDAYAATIMLQNYLDKTNS